MHIKVLWSSLERFLFFFSISFAFTSAKPLTSIWTGVIMGFLLSSALTAFSIVLFYYFIIPSFFDSITLLDRLVCSHSLISPVVVFISHFFLFSMSLSFLLHEISPIGTSPMIRS